MTDRTTRPTCRLPPDSKGIAKAAAILAQGGLVAFPTETVYGLGADARNEQAVAGIYAAKGRPASNPLIIHVADVDSAGRLAGWSDAAELLASFFWPGPLTLVLPRAARNGLANTAVAGLPGVAIRVPADPVAQALLQRFNGPVAAPSANPSGSLSPTTTEHVVSGLGQRIDAIIDGPPCISGLESTIVAPGPPVRILRPGMITAESVAAALGVPVPLAGASSGDEGARMTSPGQLASHYAPQSRLRLNARHKRRGEVLLGFGPDAARADINLSPSGDLHEAAANLFNALHRLDAVSIGTIAVSPIPRVGIGMAINDRLRRAAAPRHVWSGAPHG